MELFIHMKGTEWTILCEVNPEPEHKCIVYFGLMREEDYRAQSASWAIRMTEELPADVAVTVPPQWGDTNGPSDDEKSEIMHDFVSDVLSADVLVVCLDESEPITHYVASVAATAGIPTVAFVLSDVDLPNDTLFTSMIGTIHNLKDEYEEDTIPSRLAELVAEKLSPDPEAVDNEDSGQTALDDANGDSTVPRLAAEDD